MCIFNVHSDENKILNSQKISNEYKKERLS